MLKRIGAFALVICLLIHPGAPAFAAQLGPAKTYDDLLTLAASAHCGDTLLVAGKMTADASRPLTTSAEVLLSGDDGAVISDLRVQDARLVLSDLSLSGGLTVSGSSHILLARGVSVSGGLSFCGSGTLLLERGASVVGGEGKPGISIRHTGGDLYISLDGAVRGGDGDAGGAAVVIDPLLASGALMVSGELTGGEGEAFGGNALNLYNLSGNALITVDGKLTGGEGDIGGSGLQLITADGSVSAGLGGRISGGEGVDYGGDAMLLMNVGGDAVVSLSGELTGGDSSGTDSTPGQSLKLLGRTTAMRTNVDNCILQDGRQVLHALSVTPLPAITSSVDASETIEPTSEPSPEPSALPATPGEAQSEQTAPPATPGEAQRAS